MSLDEGFFGMIGVFFFLVAGGSEGGDMREEQGIQAGWDVTEANEGVVRGY